MWRGLKELIDTREGSYKYRPGGKEKWGRGDDFVFISGHGNLEEATGLATDPEKGLGSFTQWLEHRFGSQAARNQIPRPALTSHVALGK